MRRSDSSSASQTTSTTARSSGRLGDTRLGVTRESRYSYIKAPMRKQGDQCGTHPENPRPCFEAARIIPRLAPGGLQNRLEERHVHRHQPVVVESTGRAAAHVVRVPRVLLPAERRTAARDHRRRPLHDPRTIHDSSDGVEAATGVWASKETRLPLIGRHLVAV